MIERILSGGQTGADRAGLDWAIAQGMGMAGGVQEGDVRKMDGFPDYYALREHESASYVPRTEQNVVDSDGTVVFSLARELTGGCKRTADLAQKHGKPLLHIHAQMTTPGARLREFVTANELKVLNVAGPRASGEPQVGEFVLRVLDEAFSETSG